MITRFLFRPTKPFKVNQKFGENMACIDENGKVFVKTNESDPCPSGTKSVYGNMDGHNGLDLQAKKYQNISSSTDGIVTELVSEEDRGLGIGITTTSKFYCFETDKKEYFKIRYWHNAVNLVKLGQEVRIGDLIALADSTGYSSGNHLHFEIKPVDVVLDRKGKIVKTVNLLANNGYFGAVNPTKYMNHEYAKTFTGVKTLVQRLMFILKLIKN